VLPGVVRKLKMFWGFTTKTQNFKSTLSALIPQILHLKVLYLLLTVNIAVPNSLTLNSKTDNCAFIPHRIVYYVKTTKLYCEWIYVGLLWHSSFLSVNITVPNSIPLNSNTDNYALYCIVLCIIWRQLNCTVNGFM
jgi:hypothetical protein